MPHQEDELEEDSPGFFWRFHLIIFVMGYVIGFPFLILPPSSLFYAFITMLSICFTCMLMLGIGLLMKFGMVYIHKRLNTEEMKRCQSQMIIGLGAVAMCGIIQKIIFFFIDDPYIFYYSFMTCSFTSFMFYSCFDSLEEEWRVIYEKKHIPLILILLAIQIIVVIITIIINIELSDRVFNFEDGSCLLWLILIEIYTSLLIAPSMIDIGVILTGGLEKVPYVRLESVQVVRPPPPGPAPGNTILETNSLRMDCKICMEEYSESVIPRMLKECGHTICEKCAQQLLDRNNGQHLFCPFCQAVTIVKGPASQLPKNFAITNIIDERMRMNGQ